MSFTEELMTYLPIDFKNKCNVGYAFVNMISSVHIISFYQEAFPINGICIHMLSKDDYPDNEEDDKGLNEKVGESSTDMAEGL
ncbi:hypothetical protein ZEAMMB73_Zm00001d032404 [Zea mays]|uniref:Mei2-like C-terminal RNA recognition motif domain-containing protein n=1 Tax=Zea mays TaxID=4577 RepID=A0A1D6KQH6_MAIZE|nr:hypothetical protein ZEAMMB73_Zm00001d032404 [Zea mays]ONM05015.1 hypothetical protein ZEAMMB73_Zm00001d032404 [Zea mays]